MAATATSESTAPSSPAKIWLTPIEATPESFREFGQVIEASPDGDEFGPRDAQLDLSRGTPSASARSVAMPGILGVAKPSLVDKDETRAENAVKSRCGHSYVPPAVDGVRVFKISGPKFLKLDRGTWHAGPLFLEKAMDFYNLELSDTNVVDHTTHDFVEKNNVIFMFDE